MSDTNRIVGNIVDILFRELKAERRYCEDCKQFKMDYDKTYYYNLIEAINFLNTKYHKTLLDRIVDMDI